MKGVRELNLELGYPSVDDALKRLDAELYSCRHLKQPVLKLIHGYGSSGSGGKIRTAVRKHLQNVQVKSIICGEDFSIFSEDTRRAFSLCDALRRDKDLDASNKGITLIVL